ncbi:MAG: hypothetical protein JWL71_1384 [Acidobacteria bacterium]|nr:hypothetical protein [Acidobacteriota bacterium]
MTRRQTPALVDRLHALAFFAPQFEAVDFQFGAWAHSDDPHEVTYYEVGLTGVAMVDTCYSMGWVIEGFDWPAWKDSDEAVRLRDDAQTVATATADQLACVLTVVIRQERFVEGSLAGHVESGLITNILRRAAALEADLISLSR